MMGARSGVQRDIGYMPGYDGGRIRRRRRSFVTCRVPFLPFGLKEKGTSVARALDPRAR